MIVRSKIACPEQQEDGSWKVIVKEFDEDIPDKGRHCLFCNACPQTQYPECIEICDTGKKLLEEGKS